MNLLMTSSPFQKILICISPLSRSAHICSQCQSVADDAVAIIDDLLSSSAGIAMMNVSVPIVPLFIDMIVSLAMFPRIFWKDRSKQSEHPHHC